jgi:hypothetical protein
MFAKTLALALVLGALVASTDAWPLPSQLVTPQQEQEEKEVVMMVTAKQQQQQQQQQQDGELRAEVEHSRRQLAPTTTTAKKWVQADQTIAVQVARSPEQEQLLVPVPQRRLASQTCTGSSSNLPQDRCDAWGDFYDALTGDGWTYCKGTKSDPCSCKGYSGVNPVCNGDGTTVITMCVTRCLFHPHRRARAAPPPPPALHRNLTVRLLGAAPSLPAVALAVSSQPIT